MGPPLSPGWLLQWSQKKGFNVSVIVKPSHVPVTATHSPQPAVPAGEVDEVLVHQPHHPLALQALQQVAPHLLLLRLFQGRAGAQICPITKSMQPLASAKKGANYCSKDVT